MAPSEQYYKEYRKKYYEEHADQIKKYSKNFYEKNKETISNNNLEYYYVNKEKLNKLILCKCNGKYTFKNKSRHIKSQLHQRYLSNLQNSDSDSE